MGLTVGAAIIIRSDDSSGSGVGNTVEDSECCCGERDTGAASVNEVQSLRFRGLISMASRIWTRLLLVVSVSCPDCIIRSGLEVSIGLLDQNTLVWAGRAVSLSLSNVLELLRELSPANDLLYLARRRWSQSYGYTGISIPE